MIALRWLPQSLTQLLIGGTLTQRNTSTENQNPRVRFPVRVKVILPYTLLALLLVLSAAYLVTRVFLDSNEERFTNRLIETGKLAVDWMAQEENRQLATLRLMVNTEGVADAARAGDAEHLRALLLPIAINNRAEEVNVIDVQGQTLLSLRHVKGDKDEEYTASKGDSSFRQFESVQNVLQRRIDEAGDKYAGVSRMPWGDFFYVSGPILDNDGALAGALLLGKPLSPLLNQMQQETLAQATVYDLSGKTIASTFPTFHDAIEALTPEPTAQLLEQQNNVAYVRRLDVADIHYTEILAPWRVRSRQNIGLVGVALAETFWVHASVVTRVQIFLFVTLALALVVGVGIFLADRITQPLMRVVRASTRVAQGDLQVQVDMKGNDEVTVLAYSFNQMVSALREGALYRDLLGRTVSPEVRDQLRKSLASGDLQLQGQESVATVLMADIRGFTSIAEKADSATVMNWLNEYFGELVPIITSHGGVVNMFQGDALLAFFGILPRPLAESESAYRACVSAIVMLRSIESVNRRRASHGEPPFVTGIGINTGPVTAGGLGTPDRWYYTIIGDTVNTTQRLEQLTRPFGESAAVISACTVAALGDWAKEFRIAPLGAQTFKGKSEPMAVYRLMPDRSENGADRW